MKLLLNWLLSALGLMIVAYVVPGFHINSFVSALIAALVIGLINATLGFFLKVVTFPLAILTLGIFWLVVNALMLRFATWFVPGFRIDTFWDAFIGAIVLMLVNLVLRKLVREPAH
jgi:putative membrane protein